MKIWEMAIGNQIKASKLNEKLIQSLVRYLNEMASLKQIEQYFQSQLLNIFNALIIPNITLAEDDIEEYNDEPEKYIMNDLEESDSESRRRECMKFVSSVSQKFPNEVSALVSQFVENLL